MFIITLVKFWESGVVFPSKILQERRSNKDVSLIESVRKAKFLGGNPVYIEAKYPPLLSLFGALFKYPDFLVFELFHALIGLCEHVNASLSVYDVSN